MRRHRPTRHYSPSISGDDRGRDLRIFVSSLIIGICIGAFGVYMWIERPHSRQIAMLRAELGTAQGRAASCTSSHNTTLGQREELESDLATCRASLSRARQNVTALATGEDASAPPVPRVPPGRSVELNENPPGDAAEAALALPTAPAEPPAAIVPPATNTFIPPSGWPTLPEPPPADHRTVSTPAAPPAEPVAPPAEPAVPPAVTEPAITEPVPPAAVWPDGFPPQPRTRPTPPPAAAAEPIHAAAAGSATAALLRGIQQVTLNVGEEESIGNGHHLRLIAVSRRNAGRYCIVAGNGMDSVRVPSGGSARAVWSGQAVVINAGAQDGDTCRITVRPQ